MTTIDHHQVTAELIRDEQGEFISLEQAANSMDEPSTVYLHPWQLKALLEQPGMSAGDIDAANTMATLERRLLVLRERAEALHDQLSDHHAHEQAMSSAEAFAKATLEIANEFCHGLDSSKRANPETVKQCASARAKTDKVQASAF